MAPPGRKRGYSQGGNLAPRLSVSHKGDNDDEVLDPVVAQLRRELNEGIGGAPEQLTPSSVTDNNPRPSPGKSPKPNTPIRVRVSQVLRPLQQWQSVPFISLDPSTAVESHIEYAEGVKELLALWQAYIQWLHHYDTQVHANRTSNTVQAATYISGSNNSIGYDEDSEYEDDSDGEAADDVTSKMTLGMEDVEASFGGLSHLQVCGHVTLLTKHIIAADLKDILQWAQWRKRQYPHRAVLTLLLECLQDYATRHPDEPSLPPQLGTLLDKLVTNYAKAADDLSESPCATAQHDRDLRAAVCDLILAVTAEKPALLQQRYDEVSDMFDDFDSINYQLDGPRPSTDSTACGSSLPAFPDLGRMSAVGRMSVARRGTIQSFLSGSGSHRSPSPDTIEERRPSFTPQRCILAKFSQNTKTLLCNLVSEWACDLIDEDAKQIRDPELFESYMTCLANLFDVTQFSLDLVSKYFHQFWNLSVQVNDMGVRAALSEAVLIAFQSLAAGSLKLGADYLISCGPKLPREPPSDHYLVTLGREPCYVTLSEYIVQVAQDGEYLNAMHVLQIRGLVDVESLLKAVKAIFFRAVQPDFADKTVQFLIIWMREQFSDFSGQANSNTLLRHLLTARPDLRAVYDDLDSRLHTADSLVTALMTTSEGLDSVDMKYCLMVYQWFLRPEDFFTQMVKFVRKLQSHLDSRVAANPHFTVTKEYNRLRWSINVKVIVISTVVKTWVTRFFSDWAPDKSNIYMQWREFVRSFPKDDRLEAMQEAGYLAKEELEAYYTAYAAGLHTPPREDDFLLTKLQRVGLIPPWYTFSMGSNQVKASVYATTVALSTHRGNRLPQDLDLLSDKGIQQASESLTTIDALMYRNLRRLIGSTFRQGAQSVNSDSCNGESVAEWRAQIRNGVDDMLERRADTIKLFVMHSLASTTSLQNRAETLRGLIALARLLKKINSLHSATLLTQALLSKEVEGLTQSWALLPSEARKNISDLKKLIAPAENYAALVTRFEKAKKGKLSRVPYLGALTADLYRIGEAGTELQEASDEVIPWRRWRALAVMIDQFVHDPRPYGYTPPSELLRAAAFMDKTLYTSTETVFKERLDRQLGDLADWEKLGSPEEVFFVDLRNAPSSRHIFRGLLVRKLALVRLSIAAGIKLRPMTIMLGSRGENDPEPSAPNPPQGRRSVIQRLRGKSAASSEAKKQEELRRSLQPAGMARRRRGAATPQASLSENFEEAVHTMYTTHIAGGINGNIVDSDLLEKWLVQTHNS